MTTILLHCAPVLAAGFRAVLEDLSGFVVCAASASLAETMERIPLKRPDVLLIEVTPALSLDILRQIMTSAGNAPVVLWIDEVSTEYASQAIAIGIRGLLRKSQSLELHAKCMRKVAAGEMWVEKSLRNKLVGIERIALTPRERQLLGLLARGLKNKEIAYAMDITEGTVKMYLTHLFRKAGANDRLELALFTLRNLSGQRTGAAEPDAQAPPEDIDTSGAGRFVPGFMILDRVPATV